MEQFQQALEQAEVLDLALVDISGFDRSIWEYCEQLSHRGVPLLIISPQKIARIQQESLAHGARGVLFKPVVIKELSTMIRTMLRDRRRE